MVTSRMLEGQREGKPVSGAKHTKAISVSYSNPQLEKKAACFCKKHI